MPIRIMPITRAAIVDSVEDRLARDNGTLIFHRAQKAGVLFGSNVDYYADGDGYAIRGTIEELMQGDNNPKWMSVGLFSFTVLAANTNNGQVTCWDSKAHRTRYLYARSWSTRGSYSIYGLVRALAELANANLSR